VADDLRARLAEALRGAADACDGHCGRTDEECHAENPVQATEYTFSRVSYIEGPVEAIADTVMPVVAELAAERDGAYRERAQVVALLAAHYPAVITRATDIPEGGWHLLYLDLAGRQCSWHIAPRDLYLFDHVPVVDLGDPRARWDGHSTEEKYRRIGQRIGELGPQCGPECSEGHTYEGRCEGHRQRSDVEPAHIRRVREVDEVLDRLGLPGPGAGEQR